MDGVLAWSTEAQSLSPGTYIYQTVMSTCNPSRRRGRGFEAPGWEQVRDMRPISKKKKKKYRLDKPSALFMMEMPTTFVIFLDKAVNENSLGMRWVTMYSKTNRENLYWF